MCSLRVYFLRSYYKLNQKDMKYFVIAALLATAQAAEPNGCKAGIKAKIYKDKDCEKDSHATVQAFQKDVEKTGKCISAEATKEEKAAVVTAQKDLDAAQVETKKKADALKAVPEIAVKDAKTMPVPKAMGEEKYAELKAAYVANEAAKASYKKVIDDLKKAEDDALVDAKKKAYQPYYALKSTENPDKAELAKLKKAYDDAKLPEDVDAKVIEECVKADKTFSKLFDAVPDLNDDGSNSDEQAALMAYDKADTEHEKALAAEAKEQKIFDAAAAKVDASTYSSIMTCDDKGVEFKAYTDIDCKAKKPDFDVKAPWGTCTKVGEDYMKITGASALKAAAIALVAFAGSQF